MGLKSCPMCDSEVLLTVQNKITRVFYVECMGCGTRTGNFLNKSEAIETWNMRVREDKVWERIEKFRESLKEENHYDPAYP